ncbi:hypothetical protein NA57DRAFT_34417 [Rhizodiscina lignyota]|uniref:SET domain-containing protein n=1 Tax=Rhizodiscina lignyota TaxID=1504668 RepID=A0A9P4IMR2_9PEZI|nr:hypothetical protein NA57DRAFT_34417 [Rhizodiscina lignyota]
MNTAKPSQWPENVEYIFSIKYSKNVRPETLQALITKPNTATTVKHTPGPCPRVRIKSITDPSHPAHDQHGLFASQHLAPSTYIISYVGYLHTKDEADSESNYDLSLDRELGIGVDATKHGNEARFINDYRGISDSPNAEFRDIWVDMGGGKCEKRMGVYVLGAGRSGKKAKGIAKGEEILVSYGKGFWKERNKEAWDE